MRRQVRLTDVELLEAVRGGDTAAYGTLYRRHSAAARSLARQLTQSEEAVENLLVEIFARVLELVRRGGGPASAFRPYLLASLRRYAATGAVDLADGDSLYVDPELKGLERAPLARAYLSLPERWRMALWHMEIEGADPAEAGPLLGLSGRATVELTGRARRALREAYVRLRLDGGPREECRPILITILRYMENGLPKQEAAEVDGHVAECIDCRSVFLEMVDLTQGLRDVVGQLVAGPAVDEYLADLAAHRRQAPDGEGRAGARMGCSPLAGLRAVYDRAGVSVRSAWTGAVATLGATGDRVRTPLTRLPALVRSVPAPYRAVLGGIAVAGLATVAFLLVAEPAGVLPVSISGSPNLTPGEAPDRQGPATGTPGTTGTGTPGPALARGAAPGEPVSPTTPAGTAAMPEPARSDDPVPPPPDGRGHAGWPPAPRHSSDVRVNAGHAPTQEITAQEGRSSAPERQRVRRQVPRAPYETNREQGNWEAHQQFPTREEVRQRVPGQTRADVRNHAAQDHAGRRTRPGGEKGDESGKRHAARTPHPGATGPVVAIDPLGALLRGQPGLVAVRLRNAGGADTERENAEGKKAAGEDEVVATVTLPPGVRFVARSRYGQAGVPSRAHQDGRAKDGRTKDGRAKDGGRGNGGTEDGGTGDGGTGDGGTGRGGAGSGGTGDGGTGRGGAGRGGAGSRGTGDGDAEDGGTGDGWACTAEGRVVRCARGPLAAGEVTALFLKVAVSADAPTGRAFTVRVRSGRTEATARSTAGVRGSGVAARFAADGRLVTRVVGNALVSTAAPPVPCGAAASAAPGRGAGISVPVDLDADDSTPTSSCADLALPRAGRVLWAGLYWSADGRRAHPTGDVRVRAPGSPAYVTVRAAEIARRNLPTGPGYQAFADVTSLVRAAGGGRWWVAGAAPARTGTVRHAAWGLVVLAVDERQPYTRVVVLDAAAVVGVEEEALRIPLDGLAPGGAPARIDLMVWNAEGVRAGIATDRGRGRGEDRRDAGVLAADTTGGVAVDSLHTLLGRRPTLRLATRREPAFFGVAVVSARTWS
ncbi:sigma-70 family RNA polymerase sigma factor [Microbispora amethystogenes]|uniref:RNA polymerase sigma factor n=1 Tax=Microbispora amethystogenes TaxID=1427754 RepID=UPI00340EAD35